MRKRVFDKGEGISLFLSTYRTINEASKANILYSSAGHFAIPITSLHFFSHTESQLLFLLHVWGKEASNAMKTQIERYVMKVVAE